MAVRPAPPAQLTGGAGAPVAGRGAPPPASLPRGEGGDIGFPLFHLGSGRRGEGSRIADRARSPGAPAAPALALTAVAAALFFNGFHPQWYGAALGLLTAALLGAAWRARGGVAAARPGALAALLALYWGWLGVTLLWHPVPQMGIAYFWILGALPLAYFAARLEPDAAAWWRVAGRGLLALGTALALWALWQLFVLGTAPRSAFLDLNSHGAFLNLVALPAAGAWLARGATGEGRRAGAADAAFALALALLFFAVFLTRGRGAGLGLALGLAFLVAAAGGTRGRRVLLAGLGAAAFGAADWIWQGGVAARLETLFNPASAGADRYLIWTQAWQMLLENPWTGAGIGIFWLRWPAWRAPDDMSAGFFVHNDYLHLWIEAGLPALALLLALAVAVAVRFARAAPPAAPGRRAEMAGLVAGLAAVAGHGFFNFNLYQLPILLTAGLLLARFEQLSARLAGAAPAQRAHGAGLSTAGFRAVTGALALLLISYFASQAAYGHLYRRALQEIHDGQFAAADASLLAAARMAPLADNVLTTHADLMRRLARALPPSEERRFLFAAAGEALARAEVLNPLRAENFLIRADLLRDNPDLAGAGEAAAENYRRALALNPRLYEARTGLAETLLEQGEAPQARRVLEQGLGYWYLETPEILPYYGLARRLRAGSGDAAGAAELARRMDGIAARQPAAEAALFDPARAAPAAPR